jgi:hypothetical protein
MVPNVAQTYPNGINIAGTIVGEATGGKDISFVYAGGVYSPLAIPHERSTIAHQINSAGVIVGAYVDSNSTFHGFVLSN